MSDAAGPPVTLGRAGDITDDAERGIGNPALVDGCPLTKRQTLRFVGGDIPKNGAVIFVACAGATLRPAD